MRLKKNTPLFGILLLVIIIAICVTLTSCGNQQIIDTNWTFNTAYIDLGDKTIEVQVKTWKDYENESTVQVVTTDGEVYLTDYKNVVLKGR